MTRPIAPACALALFLSSASTVWGQASPAGSSLPCRTACVRFDIIQGRLAASCVGQAQPRTSATAHSSGCPAESLAITPAGDKTNVRYQFTDARQETTIEFQGADVRLVREPRGDSAPARVKFEQLAGRDLKLVVETGGKKQEFAAPTLWHLMLAEPAVCREYLLPSLERLRADWLLAERAEKLAAALVDLCRTGAIEQRQRGAALVDLLGSGNYQARQDADRELRGLGQVVVPYLARLDKSRLDSEQRYRLRRIAEDLAVCSGDTPERAAIWMLDDQAIWLTLLAHERPEYRHEAVLQLSRICERRIEFDPAAAEIERKAQIERLREKLAEGS